MVSGVPPAQFTNHGASIMVVGRVLGTADVKGPFPGEGIPNLSFVRSAACHSFVDCSKVWR